jgi:WhiB family redox-sensing transcriptional regulator
MQTTARSYCDDDWAARAACRQGDPELFFPVSAAGPALGQQARAKAVCARCPVQQRCLDYALETGQDFGVWGGKTEDERRVLRRRRLRYRRAAARSAASPAAGRRP